MRNIYGMFWFLEKRREIPSPALPSSFRNICQRFSTGDNFSCLFALGRLANIWGQFLSVHNWTEIIQAVKHLTVPKTAPFEQKLPGPSDGQYQGWENMLSAIDFKSAVQMSLKIRMADFLAFVSASKPTLKLGTGEWSSPSAM